MPFLLVRRIVQLLLGLFLYGFSIGMMIRAGIGVSPWDVLGQGVSLQSGIPFGLTTNLIGLAVLLLWIPIRQKPGVGTILNVLLVGPSAEVALAVVPQQTELWVQILLFTAGLLLLAVATGLYIGARMGPGPRDGLMTGINRRWGWAIWKVRTGIEVSVLALGWVLGGTVGVGTVAFALLVGPLVNITLPRLQVPEGKESKLDGEATPTSATP
ncbi:membrane protein [Arthrobacter tecti]